MNAFLKNTAAKNSEVSHDEITHRLGEQKNSKEQPNGWMANDSRTFPYGANILPSSKTKKVKNLITNEDHKIIEGGHPSPLAPATNFFYKNYFSSTNEWREQNESETIDWNFSANCDDIGPCYRWENIVDPENETGC